MVIIIMILFIMAILGVIGVLFWVITAIIGVLFYGTKDGVKAYKHHKQVNQQNIQQQRLQNYAQKIAPANWKSRSRIYFADDGDVNALHCHQSKIYFFTDANKAITIPESDSSAKYYLISMNLTSANDPHYPDLKNSILTFLTTDKSKEIKVSPTIPERTAVFLIKNFLLNNLEKKQLDINI